MPKYKSLKDIVSQTNWKGIDVGKALLISYVNSKTGKPVLSKDSLETMLNTLSCKQEKIYESYKQLMTSLDMLCSTCLAYKQQFYTCNNGLISELIKIKASEQAYRDYLNLPLMINKYSLESLKELYNTDFYNNEITAYEVIRLIINETIDRYNADKDFVTPDYLPILEQYKKDKSPITIKVSMLCTEWGYEFYLKGILRNFSKIYGTKENIESILKHITTTESKTTLDKIGITEILKRDNKKYKDYIELLELFNTFKKKESEYKETAFNSLITQELIDQLAFNDPTVTKLDSLETEEVNKLTPNEFIKNYSELYNLTKEKLSKKLDVFSKPDSELINIKFTYKELIKDEVMAFVNNATPEYRQQRDEILSMIPQTPEQFLIHEKAKAGLCLAMTPVTSTEEKLYNRYGENYKFILETNEINISDCKQYQEDGIGPSLNYIFSFNSLLEVYSDIYKVNLLPLRVDVDFSTYTDAYNADLYMLYSKLTGDRKTLERKQKMLKSVFKPIDINSFRPDKAKIEDYKALLKEVAKTNLLPIGAGNYINPFMNNSFREGVKNG